MKLNILDYVWIGIAVAFCIYGYIRGFVNTFVSMIGLCFSFIIAIVYYADLSRWLEKTTGLNSTFAGILAFITLMMAAKYALVLIGGFLNFIAKAPGIHRLNRWSGALFGLFEWSIITVILIYIMRYVKTPEIKSFLAHSWVAKQVTYLMPDIIAATAQFIVYITRS